VLVQVVVSNNNNQICVFQSGAFAFSAAIHFTFFPILFLPSEFSLRLPRKKSRVRSSASRTSASALPSRPVRGRARLPAITISAPFTIGTCLLDGQPAHPHDVTANTRHAVHPFTLLRSKSDIIRSIRRNEVFRLPVKGFLQSSGWRELRTKGLFPLLPPFASVYLARHRQVKSSENSITSTKSQACSLPMHSSVYASASAYYQ